MIKVNIDITVLKDGNFPVFDGHVAEFDGHVTDLYEYMEDQLYDYYCEGYELISLKIDSANFTSVDDMIEYLEK